MSFMILTSGSEFNASHLMSNFMHVRGGNVLPLGGIYMLPTTSSYSLGNPTYIYTSVSCEYLNTYQTINFLTTITASYGGVMTLFMVTPRYMNPLTSDMPIAGFYYCSKPYSISYYLTETASLTAPSSDMNLNTHYISNYFYNSDGTAISTATATILWTFTAAYTSNSYYPGSITKIQVFSEFYANKTILMSRNADISLSDIYWNGINYRGNVYAPGITATTQYDYSSMEFCGVLL